MMEEYVHQVRTRLGVVGIRWIETKAGPRVTRVVLPPPGQTVSASGVVPPGVRRLGKAVAGFVSGRGSSLDLKLLRLEVLEPFTRKAVLGLLSIPAGKVTTYGRLAARLGRFRAARAVGNAMAANPFPLLLPCHRVIRADGTLGGFGGGLRMKRALLEAEGIVFVARDRVSSGSII